MRKYNAYHARATRQVKIQNQICLLEMCVLVLDCRATLPRGRIGSCWAFKAGPSGVHSCACCKAHSHSAYLVFPNGLLQLAPGSGSHNRKWPCSEEWLITPQLDSETCPRPMICEFAVSFFLGGGYHFICWRSRRLNTKTIEGETPRRQADKSRGREFPDSVVRLSG